MRGLPRGRGVLQRPPAAAGLLPSAGGRNTDCSFCTDKRNQKPPKGGKAPPWESLAGRLARTCAVRSPNEAVSSGLNLAYSAPPDGVQGHQPR